MSPKNYDLIVPSSLGCGCGVVRLPKAAAVRDSGVTACSPRVDIPEEKRLPLPTQSSELEGGWRDGREGEGWREGGRGRVEGGGRVEGWEREGT